MDYFYSTALCISSLVLLSFVLFYEANTRECSLPPQLPNKTLQLNPCQICTKIFPDIVNLEACEHKLCKVCLEIRLQASQVVWQNHNGKQFKVAQCPICKEFYRVWTKTFLAIRCA